MTTLKKALIIARFTPFLILLLLLGCSQTQEDHYLLLDELSSFPKLYSYENKESINSLNLKNKQILSTTETNALLPELSIEENHVIYPLHSISTVEYRIAVFLERDTTMTMIEDNDQLHLMIYNDQLHLMIYNDQGQVTDSKNILLLDIYGSFEELLITDNSHLSFKQCDLEFSPDEESALTNDIYTPDINITSYSISKDSLKLQLINHTVSKYIPSRE